MQLKIEKIIYNGYGLARYNGRVFFIENVLPEEIVEIEEVERKKTYSFAKPVKFININKSRIDPPCKYYGSCGGCHFQHIKYSFQLKLKKEIIFETLRRIANIENNNFTFYTIPSLSPFYYRNSATLKIKQGKIGFYKKQTNELVEIEKCMLFYPFLQKIFETEKIDKIFSTKKGESYFNKNFVIEEVLNSKFKISKKSFFQTNIFQLDNLAEKVVENCLPFEKIADFYSGVGLFSILNAKNGKKVLGFEISKNSYKDSIDNIKINLLNTENIKFYNMDVKYSYEYLKNFKPEVLIFDPPRAGVNQKLLFDILKLNSVKRIIYISCNPTTFARDLKIILNKFYIFKMFFIDMFPQTYHIETITILERML